MNKRPRRNLWYSTAYWLDRLSKIWSLTERKNQWNENSNAKWALCDRVLLSTFERFFFRFQCKPKETLRTTVEIFYYLVSVVLCTAMADVQRATDKIILDVNHKESIYWSDNLNEIGQKFASISNKNEMFSIPSNANRFNPMVPAKLKFIAINKSILILIENGKHLL